MNQNRITQPLFHFTLPSLLFLNEQQFQYALRTLNIKTVRTPAIQYNKHTQYDVQRSSHYTRCATLARSSVSCKQIARYRVASVIKQIGNGGPRFSFKIRVNSPAGDYPLIKIGYPALHTVSRYHQFPVQDRAAAKPTAGAETICAKNILRPE